LAPDCVDWRYCVAGGEALQSGGHLAEAEPLADQGPDRAVVDEPGERRVRFCDRLRLHPLVQSPSAGPRSSSS